jgi:flavin reductase (DIM6/NTAB) family NADH-FMN oxidoreductase RutF
MVMDFTPQIGCGVGPWDYSYAALRATKECVLAVPTVDLISKVVDIGNCSGKDQDKFKVFYLSALPAEKVKAPLIGECLANIECRVVDTNLVDKYNLFILEGVKAWVDPTRKEKRTFHANGDGTFVVDGETLDLKKQMTKWQDTL